MTKRTTAFENFLNTYPEFKDISQATFYRMRSDPEILGRIAEADKNGLYDEAERKRRKREAHNHVVRRSREVSRERAPF